MLINDIKESYRGNEAISKETQESFPKERVFVVRSKQCVRINQVKERWTE